MGKTDFAPLPVGRFIAAAIERRNLTKEFVAKRTGLQLRELEEIIDGKIPLNETLSAKLERVFRRTKRTLLKIQAEDNYYRKHGILRPQTRRKRSPTETSALRATL